MGVRRDRGTLASVLARASVLYELRKDVLSFGALTTMFWLAWRPPAAAPSSGQPVSSSDFWLRGVARVHRTRLVNIGRVVGLVHRPTGDFELQLDTGELVAGSRRYKTAVAAIGKTQT
jgi:hypothetical protein